MTNTDTGTIDLLRQMSLQLALNGLQNRVNAHYDDANHDPYRVGGAQLNTTQATWTPERLIYQHIADSILSNATYEPHPGLGNYGITHTQLTQILANLAREDHTTIPDDSTLHTEVAVIHDRINDTLTSNLCPIENHTCDITNLLRQLDIAYWR